CDFTVESRIERAIYSCHAAVCNPLRNGIAVIDGGANEGGACRCIHVKYNTRSAWLPGHRFRVSLYDLISTLGCVDFLHVVLGVVVHAILVDATCTLVIACNTDVAGVIVLKMPDNGYTRGDIVLRVHNVKLAADQLRCPFTRTRDNLHGTDSVGR